MEQRSVAGTSEADVSLGEDVLFPLGDRPAGLARLEPAYFRDLHLDQLFRPIVERSAEYDLAASYHTPLRDEEAVRRRQDVFRDLEDRRLVEALRGFADRMRRTRVWLSVAEKSRYPYEGERWYLDAAIEYRDAVTSLAALLTEQAARSSALLAFARYLASYVASASFVAFASEAGAASEGLAEVRYNVHLRGLHVRVLPYQGEADFSDQVVETFAKFRRGDVRDYRVRFTTAQQVDHVEAKILERVARAIPEPFEALDRFCERHPDFVDDGIGRFDREIQFYLAYLGWIEPLVAAGLPFCYPDVSRTSKEVSASGAYDPVLAHKLLSEGGRVTPNDFSLSGPERLLVVTGPNQGGKTTFARMVGQLHHLASIGCPVPASSARLYLADRIYAHFERQEDVASLRGKLEDELIRVREILRDATSDGLVIMNESFASTTLSDARFLGQQVIERLVRRDVLGVYVTFVDELASIGPSTVSMVGQVDPDDPSVRTFEVLRRPADGLAFAQAIADKHGLSSSALRMRLAR